MKDIKRVTPIVKEKKKGQCVIRKNETINTPFLSLSWPAERHRKKGGCRFFFIKKKKEKTPNLL
jgi:hypothetical protein